MLSSRLKLPSLKTEVLVLKDKELFRYGNTYVFLIKSQVDWKSLGPSYLTFFPLTLEITILWRDFHKTDLWMLLIRSFHSAHSFHNAHLAAHLLPASQNINEHWNLHCQYLLLIVDANTIFFFLSTSLYRGKKQTLLICLAAHIQTSASPEWMYIILIWSFSLLFISTLSSAYPFKFCKCVFKSFCTCADINHALGDPDRSLWMVPMWL